MDIYSCDDCLFVFEVAVFRVSEETLSINFCPACGSESIRVEVSDE